MTVWHILTGEYPPQPGGVSDYTRLVARGLADAGEDVHVWCPPFPSQMPDERGVEIHRLPDKFGPRGLAAINVALNSFPKPRRILVQYVPHAFGWKALNVPFCLWLLSRQRDSVWIMFHEVYFPIERKQPLAHNFIGVVTRLMAYLVAHGAKGIFVSIPSWKNLLKNLAPEQKQIAWLPVPSTIPVINDLTGIAETRARFATNGQFIIGHFGTYGQHIARQLVIVLPQLLQNTTNLKALLMGRGGERICDELIRSYPHLKGQIFATGTLSPEDLSRHLSASDLMVQPFTDGVSSRRTSVMSALAHALPIVTTAGFSTEPLWAESNAVVLTKAGDVEEMVAATQRLLRNENERTRLAASAKMLYQQCFDIKHTISALLEVA